MFPHGSDKPLERFGQVHKRETAEQSRGISFLFSEARSFLPVLCGLTLPVFSLDSDQRPVLREMKEKQVRAVSGTSTQSLFVQQQFWFHLTLWLLFFFVFFRRWGGKAREATLRYDSIWSLYSLTLKKQKQIKDGCCFMTSCSHYPHSLPYPEVTTQIYPTKIKMLAHFLSCLVKKYWNYCTEFYVLQNKCPTFTYKPIYI